LSYNSPADRCLPLSDVFYRAFFLMCSFFLITLQHLLTFSLQNGEVRNVEEAQNRLSSLAQNKKLWSQQMYLDVGAGGIYLRDVQSQDELESYAFRSIFRCEAVNTEKHFPSLLMLVCQGEDQKKPDIHFFNCETVKVSADVSNSTASKSKLPPDDHRYSDCHNHAPTKVHFSARQFFFPQGILNHCFDEIEAFMGKLQQIAEAATVLNQRKKKKKKNELLATKARPPPDGEFVDIFQKFKYCFSLLARLKSTITNPSSEDLIHHVFKPLDMVTFGAAISSPALTSSAVSLLQDTLTEEERQLWTSLGPNWTHPRSHLSFSSWAPYTPVFFDGWKPEALKPDGQVWEDPVESQHKLEALREKQEVWNTSITHQTMTRKLYCCSYDFIARNSSELSVQQGETLEVIESSKRWWKCRNRFNQVGFVPFNILEPMAHIDSPVHNNPPSVRRQKRHPHTCMHVLPSYNQHVQSVEDNDKVTLVNDELLQRLTNGKSNMNKPLVIPRSADTSLPLDYHSPQEEVAEWLRGKGFSKPTVSCLGVLTGAQLFSLNKEELKAVIPEEGARVYSQLAVQKSLLEDARRATELEAVMEKQKMKVDLKLESSTL
uniref:Epidermal growth factor receptor kinase substrate 8-like protein 1 n=1 Tax=Pundamilia nyererei TaxID=303518 RepID=A0A3B4GKV8_9CICH